MSNLELIEQDSDPGSSAINAWLMFIFREISRMIAENRKTFASNRDLSYFVDLTNKFYEGEQKGF
ncbi:hypothetical protein MetexDRAFT_4631 [Methylorubrum extorquens DSM 13060]|uniref:Uncharacterized protein n=2 Tax=Methylorubrum extorquens TaxID=408 RepID=H1KPQ5_METEX|nr:hypothetical protein MetexDRAFT_4631 [Methylorubrum extorquens DSM 13060]